MSSSDNKYAIDNICYTSIDCARSSINLLMNGDLKNAKSVFSECLTIESKREEPRTSLVKMLEAKLRVIARKAKGVNK